MIKKIISVHNQEIKNIVALHNADARYKQHRYIAEGLRTCTTIMQYHQLIQLYITHAMLEQAEKICKKTHITLVSEPISKKISTTKTPSGILGVFALPTEPSYSQFSSGIVLAQLADPGNMGTLLRTCAAMNQKTVIIVEGVDPWSPKVIQATAGTLAQLNIFRMDWKTLLQHKKKLKLYALTVCGGKRIDCIDKQHVLLIIGNEAHGIPLEWEKQCEELITLDMPGGTESLNAAIAGSIAMYLTWHNL